MTRSGPLDDYMITVEFNGDCSVTFVANDETVLSSDFDCDKPIDELTMVGAVVMTVEVKAWKGSVGSTMLADLQSSVCR